MVQILTSKMRSIFFDFSRRDFAGFGVAFTYRVSIVDIFVNCQRQYNIVNFVVSH